MTTGNGNTGDIYTQQRFLFMTLDPVHVGTGGYRLGRVDMTIAREPGTRLPKIPGTSLAGAIRHYASMRYNKPEAAGQHKNFRGKKEKCPIIYTFGTVTEAKSAAEAKPTTEPTSTAEAKNGQAQQEITQSGTVSIGDACILFFPVHSMAGPVWVSTEEKVTEVWGTGSVKLPKNNGQVIKPTDKLVVTSLEWDKSLNVGWLLFTAKKGLQIDAPEDVKKSPEWKAIADRIVLVTDKLFSQVVNSNLEVRTSVSIKPETGAAEPHALFTYEAIPRATWLWCDVIEDDYKKEFPYTERQFKAENGNGTENAGDQLDKPWGRPLDVVTAGVALIKYLGVGGMGTRGFGRMYCVAQWKES
jgi:CRISPR-associated protein Cmr4